MALNVLPHASFAVAGTSAGVRTFRTAGDPAGSFVRVLGLNTASIDAATQRTVKRYWVMNADNGQLGTLGPRLRVNSPEAGVGVIDEPADARIPASAYQSNPEGVIVLPVRPGLREIYVSDRPFIESSDYPANGEPLPNNVLRFSVQVPESGTIDVDASRLLHQLFPVAPAPARDTGPVILRGVPIGWTIWMADAMRPLGSLPGVQDNGLVRVGEFFEANGGQEVVNVRVGQWGENGRGTLQVRSPDGAMRVDYPTPFYVVGAGITLEWERVLNDWANAHGGTSLTLKVGTNGVTTGWTWSVNGVALGGNMGRVRASGAQQMLRGVLDNWPGVFVDIPIRVGIEPIVLNVQPAISRRMLGAVTENNRALVEALTNSISGRPVAPPPPPAPPTPPAVSTTPAALRVTGPAGWLVSLTTVGGPPNPAAAARLPLPPPGIVPVPIGHYDLVVSDAAGRVGRRTINILSSGLDEDVTSYLPAVADPPRARLLVRGPAGFTVAIANVGSLTPLGAARLPMDGPIEWPVGSYDLGAQSPITGEIRVQTITIPPSGLDVDVTSFFPPGSASLGGAGGAPPPGGGTGGPAATAQGSIIIAGAPTTWPVLLDGAVVSRSVLANVTPGSHSIGVRPPTGADLVQTVTVQAGPPTTVDFTALVAAMPPTPTGDAAIGRIVVRNLPTGWRLESAYRVTRVEAGQTLTSQMPFEATTPELLSRGLPAGEWALRATGPDGRVENRIATVGGAGSSVEVDFTPVGATASPGGINLVGLTNGYTVRVVRIADNALAVTPFVVGGGMGGGDPVAGLAALQRIGPGRFRVTLVESDMLMQTRVPVIYEGARLPGTPVPPSYPNQPITTQGVDVDVPAGAVVTVDMTRALTAAVDAEAARRRAWDAAQVVTGTVQLTQIPPAFQTFAFVLRAPFVTRDGHNVRANADEFPLQMMPPTLPGGGVDMSGQSATTASASVPGGFYSLEVSDTGLPAGTCSPVGGAPPVDPRCAPWVAASVEVRVGQNTLIPWPDLARLREVGATPSPTNASPPGTGGASTVVQPVVTEPQPMGTYASGTVTVRDVPRAWMASVTQQVPPGGVNYGAPQQGAMVFQLTGSGQLAVTNKLAGSANLAIPPRSVSVGASLSVGRAVADVVYAPNAQPLGIGVTSMLPDGRKAGYLAPNFAAFAGSMLEPGTFDREVAEFDRLPVLPAHAAELADKVVTAIYVPGKGFGAIPLASAELEQARRAVAGASFGNETFLASTAGTVAKGAAIATVGGGLVAAAWWAWRTWSAPATTPRAPRE